MKSIRIKARKSPIWKISKQSLETLIKKSTSITEILSHFGLKNIGGNYITLRKRMDEDSIDYSHIPKGLNHRKGKKYPGERSLTREECLTKIFVINENPYSKKFGTIKRYLKRYSLIPYECKCGLNDIWEEQKLSLQLDHKNGNTEDNRIENLRWLCPNCHSQTPTFAGRTLRKEKCQKISEINPLWRKRARLNSRKVIRPLKEELQMMINTIPMIHIGKQYGVSDNAVRKWCKYYKISKMTNL